MVHHATGGLKFIGALVLGASLATASGCCTPPRAPTSAPAQNEATSRGAALLSLLQVENEYPPIAIHGDVVGEDGARTAWVVLHRGVILSVAEERPRLPPSGVYIEYDGYMYPGLIDTHNHIPFAVVPKWTPGPVFVNRYEWRNESPAYQTAVKDRYVTLTGTVPEGSLWHAATKYGEIRGLIGGTTAMEGCKPDQKQSVLIRNLDQTYLVADFVDPLDPASEEAIQEALRRLEAGTLRRIFVHVAEGKRTDPRSGEEFGRLRTLGLVRPGVVLIHGIALTCAELAEAARHGMYLVWSPQSNLALYGETAPVPEALDAGLTVCLAPDWTISGSDNLLEEIKVAARYSAGNLNSRLTPRDLFLMSTRNAARAAGVDGFLGSIEAGHAADLFLAPRLAPDPYENLLLLQPCSIHAVIVDGLPLYGDAGFFAQVRLPVGASLDQLAEKIQIGGAEKLLLARGDVRLVPDGDAGIGDIERDLGNRLGVLAPLEEP